MEYSIGFGEILTIVKRNIKNIVVLALIMALLFGGYGIKKTLQNSLTDEEKKNLETKQSNYQNWEQKRIIVQEDLQDKLVKAYDVAENNPVMKVDPSNAEIISWTYAIMDDAGACRYEIFKSWINKLNCKELFGTESDSLKKYKNDYIYIIGNVGEVVVSVLKSKEYDYHKVAKNLDLKLKKKATNAGIKITSSERAEVKGFVQPIVDRQDLINNNVQRIQNELNTLKSSSFENPGNPEESKGRSLIKIIIYVIAGIFIGAVIGTVLAMFKVIRRGTVLSTGQIDEFFGLQKIAEGRNNDNDYPRTVDTILVAIEKEDENIALVGPSYSEEYNGFAEKMNAVSDRQYYFVNAAEEDTSTLEVICDVNKVLIPVTLGKSSYKDIQTVIKWAQKYRKDLLGYLVLKY